MGKWTQSKLEAHKGEIRAADCAQVSIADCCPSTTVGKDGCYHTDHDEAEANAARLAACWNACQKFDDPEAAIGALVLALRMIKTQVTEKTQCWEVAARFTNETVDAALALVKE